MPGHITAGPVHHLRLTVTDIQRSRQFYTSLLGFQVAVESPPPGDPSEAEAFRILIFSVASRYELEQAVRLFDEQGVTHGSITRLPSFDIDVLPFEDPDDTAREGKRKAAPAASGAGGLAAWTEASGRRRTRGQARGGLRAGVAGDGRAELQTATDAAALRPGHFDGAPLAKHKRMVIAAVTGILAS
jgi:glyoxylase I family protein